MNVIVTGSTGFLGSRVTSKLVANPQVHKVYCTYRGHLKMAHQKMGRLSDHAKITWIPFDLARSTADVIEGPFDSSHRCGVIVHCAALDGYRFSSTVLTAANVRGTSIVLDAASRLGARVLYTSSCAAALIPDDKSTVCPHGFATHYAWSKKVAQSTFLGKVEQGLLPPSSRCFNIGYLYDDAETGSNVADTQIIEVIWNLCRALRAAPLLRPDARFIDFTHVDDAAQEIADTAMGSVEHSASGLVNLQHVRPLDWNETFATGFGQRRRHNVLPYHAWRDLALWYCAKRGSRLDWISNLLTADVEEQINVMFSPPSCPMAIARRMHWRNAPSNLFEKYTAAGRRESSPVVVPLHVCSPLRVVALNERIV